jgi:predicted  nucleic acid-binding Zn-ribbon protein
MTEGKASVGFLKTELHRLAADEEGRKKDYHWARAELQEIWDKLVSLRSHINKFQSDIENAKIEEIMRGAGSVMASNYSSASGETYLSLDSANRAASINKLKEKIRMKDVLKGRISMLEEKIVEGRKQLPRVTESLKLAGLQSQANLSTDLNISTVSTPGSSADASLSRTMALRQAILTISDKINTWENELLHARNDLKDLEVDLSGEISSITMGHPGAASSGADVADSSVLSRIGPTPSKLAQSNSHVSAQQSARKTQNLNSTPARDDSINDIIAHGPPLSSSLASALRTGACGSASAGITAAGADSSGWTMMQDCEFSVYEVITGQAAVVRLNGEAPALYVMRLQRRLGSLLTLELQMQLEFEGKVAQVKQYRDAVSVLCIGALGLLLALNCILLCLRVVLYVCTQYFI